MRFETAVFKFNGVSAPLSMWQIVFRFASRSMLVAHFVDAFSDIGVCMDLSLAYLVSVRLLGFMDDEKVLELARLDQVFPMYVSLQAAAEAGQ